MIKKTILTALVLFLGYSFFIKAIAPRWWQTSQHLWQDNIIKAQKFIYSDNPFNNVIVGSSLSYLLLTDSLPNTFSLSFGGQSVFEGLNILVRSKNIPKCLFIEMNFILRPENKQFTKALNSRILYYSRKAFPVLRDENQPLGAIGRYIELRASKFALQSKLEIQTSAASNIFEELLTIQKKRYAELPDPAVADDAFRRLKKYIYTLENRGVKITFFEMPVDKSLNNSPRANLIRGMFHRHFAASHYQYVPIPEWTNYETTDGLHLTHNEALLYTIYFRRYLKIDV